jgi:hypothetical protein
MMKKVSVSIIGCLFVAGCSSFSLHEVPTDRRVASSDSEGASSDIADFNGNWSGKILSGESCVQCSDKEKRQKLDAEMSSSEPTLQPITSMQRVEFSIFMGGGKITLPRMELVYRGDISGGLKSETYEIVGNNLIASPCPQVSYSIQKNYCPLKKGTISGNVITIFDPDYMDDGLAVVQYILDPNGTLRYGYGVTEVSHEGETSDDRFRISRVDFHRQ